MSAFIVDDLHINAIVTYAVDKQLTYWNAGAREHVHVTNLNAEAIGRILMDENVRSYCARYSDASDDDKSAGAAYAYKVFPIPLTAAEIIKACNCLEYQSCETDDWEASLAWRILQNVKAKAVHDLPGYESAPWEITENSIDKLKHKNLRHAIRLT